MIIDFSYRTHACIVKKIDNTDDSNGEDGGCNIWKPFYIGYCIVCILATIGFIAAMFVIFPCPFAWGVSAGTALVAVLCVVLSLVECFSCGLLPGANVAFYITWVTWSALSSDPKQGCDISAESCAPEDAICNPHFSTMDLNDVGGVVLSFIITFITITWMGVSMGGGIGRLCNQPDDFSKFEEQDEDKDEEIRERAQDQLDKKLAGEDVEMAELEGADDFDVIGKEKKSKKARTTKKGKLGKDEQEPAAPTPCKERVAILLFHLALFSATFYLAMICTFWVNALDVSALDSTSDGKIITGSDYAVGAKLCAAIATFIVFLWSLLTALCCDVGQEDEE